jgi:nicotinamidase-related amidase
MLLSAQRSALLVIDMQQKLLPAIPDGDHVLSNAVWMMRAALKLGIPVAATVQYPRGLGPLSEAVGALVPETAVGTKNHFSCVAAGCLPSLPGADRAQVVLVGVEAHVCVLQTALDLMEEGREVYIAADCVASRRSSDRELALARMRQEGARIVSREMAVFEWLKEAGTPLFKEVSKEFLRDS